MYRDNKYLRLNKAAHFLACLIAVGCLRRADLMVYVNTWKFTRVGTLIVATIYLQLIQNR